LTVTFFDGIDGRKYETPASPGFRFKKKGKALPPFRSAAGFDRPRAAAQRRSGHLCQYLGHICRVERPQCLSSDVA
jgi:hypothetical protein